MAYAKNSIYAVKTCRVCGDRLYDEQFSACGACRLTEAIRSLAWRTEQKRRGLCCACVDPSHYGRTGGVYRKHLRCRHHLQYDNDWHNARFHRLRAKGLCAKCGVVKTARSGGSNSSSYGYKHATLCEGCK